MTKSIVRPLMAGIIGIGMFGLATPAFSQTNSNGINKFNRAGPERVTTARVSACTRFLPPQGAVNSRGGLGWANGTGASPTTYNGILTRVASFGTLVSAANTTQSGSGQATSTCITQLDQARTDANGRFATSGHSQGGSGCINASRLNPRSVVTCPVELDGTFTANSNPADIDGTQTGPAMIMCGGQDTLAPCNRQANGDGKFNGARVPVIRVSVTNASHFTPTGGGGLFAALTTACVEAAVGGDAEASQALRSGLQNGNQVSRVARRNIQ